MADDPIIEMLKMVMTPQDERQAALAFASSLHTYIEAYQEAGFTREEAMQITCAVIVAPNRPSPDQEQRFSRMNALVEHMLADISKRTDDD